MGQGRAAQGLPAHRFVGRLSRRRIARREALEEKAAPPARRSKHDERKSHHAIPTGAALRVKALETLLEEKGLVDSAALDSLIDTFETKVGPRNGARIVAKAWTDAAFRKRLLENATTAVAELGYGGPEGGHLVAVENTPQGA